jgi:hypothetical protein
MSLDELHRSLEGIRPPLSQGQLCFLQAYVTGERITGIQPPTQLPVRSDTGNRTIFSMYARTEDGREVRFFINSLDHSIRIRTTRADGRHDVFDFSHDGDGNILTSLMEGARRLELRADGYEVPRDYDRNSTLVQGSTGLAGMYRHGRETGHYRGSADGPPPWDQPPWQRHKQLFDYIGCRYSDAGNIIRVSDDDAVRWSPSAPRPI